MAEPTFRTVLQSTTGLVPGLRPVFDLVDLMYSRCANMKKCKAQCESFADFCAEVVIALNFAMKDASTMDDSGRVDQHLQALRKLLDAALADMEKIEKWNVLEAVFLQPQAKQAIKDHSKALQRNFIVFGFTAQLSLPKWTARQIRAEQEDQARLINELDNSEGNPIPPVSAPSSSASLHEIAESALPALPSVRPEHVEDKADLLRVLQVGLHAEPEGTESRAACASTLRDLQRATGDTLLPLADLCGETTKDGAAPVHSNGAFEVWKGRWLNDESKPVALKYLRDHNVLSQQALLRFQRQVEIIHRIEHRHIIPFYGVEYSDKAITALVTPWMKNGNILSYISQHPDADRTLLMLQVARGLAYLHAHQPTIVHRSVLPTNILVNDTEEAVISDFGLAKALQDASPDATAYTVSSGASNAMRYMAAELNDEANDEHGRYGPPADVYAWAMSYLHVLSGKAPFPNVKQAGRVVIMVNNGKFPDRADYGVNTFTDAVWALLIRCWGKDATSRPTMEQVVSALREIRPDLP
ncbi:kinase-like protein [Exidia glandulosa HHB12029]|uniref:Kinase-like protein n=1 Tax=Exidia glandulosa HHB12029 TaxID=1314781 RepID=A0A166N0T1_EXIGL|nr:kinase-like protein [Exidia glandulosa HHB12029]